MLTKGPAKTKNSESIWSCQNWRFGQLNMKSIPSRTVFFFRIVWNIGFPFGKLESKASILLLIAGLSRPGKKLFYL